MKKFLLILIGLCILSSCQKDEIPCTSSNCGTIANDGIDINADGSFCYWLEIRSECTGEKKKFCFDEDVWMSNFVGDYFCVTNEPGW